VAFSRWRSSNKETGLPPASVSGAELLGKKGAGAKKKACFEDGPSMLNAGRTLK